MTKIKKVVVDDCKKTTNKNEQYVIKTAQKNRKQGFVMELEAFEVTKKGAYQLSVAIGEDGLRALFDEEIESEFIKSRFSLGHMALLCDLMDALPCYASIHLDIEVGDDMYHVVLVKESFETPQSLASFRIPELKMSFND